MYNEYNIFIIIKTLTPLPHRLKYIPLVFKKLSEGAIASTFPPHFYATAIYVCFRTRYHLHYINNTSLDNYYDILVFCFD
jgi:hypothetical protein